MKNIFYFSILLFLPLLTWGQSQDKNYILTKTYTKPTTGTITADDIITTVQYYDGMGRPIQRVDYKAGGKKQDIVTPIIYDEGGNMTKSYLPYANPNVVANSLEYRGNNSLITNIDSLYYSKFPNDFTSQSVVNPYSETFYDGSPLNRVVKQGAPGSDWKGNTTNDNDHTIKQSYSFNQQNEVYRFKVIFTSSNTEAPELSIAGYYEPWELYKTVTKNENWTSVDGYNKTTQEFKDKEGRVVLTRSFNEERPHDTYYVYDKYSNLTYVIPPVAADAIVQGEDPVIYAGRNYAWTTLAEVDSKLAEQYEKELSAYDNSEILNIDLLDYYGGQGGFSILPHQEKGIILSLNMAFERDMPLKTGNILGLKEFGVFEDKELGRISGFNSTGKPYEYLFSIKGNNLFVDGSGNIPSTNLNLYGDYKLEYTTNVPWPTLCNVDAEIADQYYDAIKNEDNAVILNNYYENALGARGGVSISVDANNALSFSLHISSDVPLSLKNGAAFPLAKLQRRLTNRTLGTIQGEGYLYYLSLRDNYVYIEGEGVFTNLNFNATLNEEVMSLNLNMSVLEGLCYIYHYDYRNRVIEKKIPGKGWEYMVYDKLNRVILTQDDKTRTQENKWLFTKYDQFDRVLYTGYMLNGALRSTLQNNAMNQNKWHETRSVATFNGNGVNVYYTNQVYPKLTDGTSYTVNTINYYDDYNAATISTPPSTVYGESVTTVTKSLPTASWVRVMDPTNPNKYIATTLGYDKKARLIYSLKNDTYLKYYETVKLQLDFTGKVLMQYTSHAKENSTQTWFNTSFVDYFTYDHMGRLLKHTKGETEYPTSFELISSNTYDELGQLVYKKVGGKATASNSLQTLDYTYNVRGWLKAINNPDTTLSGGDMFAFRINYNKPSLSGSTALYNGNISETFWRSKTDNKMRSYSYKYDDMNRLIDANYTKQYGLVNNPSAIENYTEGNINYDKNGNITSLVRWGLFNDHGMDNIDKIDVLTYIYEPFSNRLLSVNDNATDEGFYNGANTTVEYEYDINGNMTSDRNKKIQSIAYNYLNLPTRVVFEGGSNTIDYIYDAAGRKLKKTVTNSGNVTVTEYNGGFVYVKENSGSNKLQYIPMAEGYITKGPNVGGETFKYVYQFKDHLGNVRLTYTDVDGNGSIANNEVIEESNYYAFGLQHKGYNANVNLNSNGNAVAQKWKYNGTELEEALGYNMYEMDARQYDPALARWVVIDPVLHHSLSPYNAFDNNPVFWADPSGADAEINSLGVTFTGNDAVGFYNALLGVLNGGEGKFEFSGDVTYEDDPYQENESQEGGGVVGKKYTVNSEGIITDVQNLPGINKILFFDENMVDLRFNDLENDKVHYANEDLWIGDRLYYPISPSELVSAILQGGIEPLASRVGPYFGAGYGYTALYSWGRADFTHAYLVNRYNIKGENPMIEEGGVFRSSYYSYNHYFRFGDSRSIYNLYDAGNFMWGAWMRFSRYSYGEVLFGSYTSSFLMSGSIDSSADQRAIKNGFYFGDY